MSNLFRWLTTKYFLPFTSFNHHNKLNFLFTDFASKVWVPGKRFSFSITSFLCMFSRCFLNWPMVIVGFAAQIIPIIFSAGFCFLFAQWILIHLRFRPSKPSFFPSWFHFFSRFWSNRVKNLPGTSPESNTSSKFSFPIKSNELLLFYTYLQLKVHSLSYLSVTPAIFSRSSSVRCCIQ